jgi:hypothetical protein
MKRLILILILALAGCGHVEPGIYHLNLNRARTPNKYVDPFRGGVIRTEDCWVRAEASEVTVYWNGSSDSWVVFDSGQKCRVRKFEGSPKTIRYVEFEGESK